MKLDIKTKEKLFERIDKAIDTIRPHLQVDGGDIEVVEITDDLTLKLKWVGNCEYCSMSSMTMKAGVEQAIKTLVPEIVCIEVINGVSTTI